MESPSNGLTSEDGTEIDFAAPEADAATGGDGDRLFVERIIELGKSLVDARGAAIELGRTSHADCLVLSLVVVAVDEVIELGVLLEEVLSCRF